MAALVTVSVAWLQEQLESGGKGLRVVDGSWHLPMWKRDAEAEYVSEHIEGAVRFNVDDIRDKSAPLPRAIPSPEQFSEQVGKLGISNDDHVIVYDNNENFGMFSAPRIRYMFKLFGHANVSILDGGLPKWKTSGGKTVSGPQPEIPAAVYKATYRNELYRSFEQVLEAYNSNTIQILDARSPGRFNGTQPEPNPKVPSGRMNGSTNMFWRNFINPDTKLLKTPGEIKQLFSSNDVKFEKPAVAACGSGMTACWIHLAAEVAENKDVPVYVGSWLEWHKKGPDDSKTLGVKGEDL